MAEKKARKNISSKKRKFSNYLKDAVMYLIGAVLFAVSVDVFTARNNIAPGGLTGIATIINYLTDLPIGVMIMIMNIPLFLLAIFLIGLEYGLRSGICLVLTSVAVDVLAPILPVYEGNPLLAAIFGGAAMGVALGIIFMRGGSTGGADIIARIMHKYFPHVTQGNLILCIDIMVITGAAFVYGFEEALYAVIAVFVSSFMVDRVLYGMDTGKLMYIITDKFEEVNSAINEELDRGTTLLRARGGYSGNRRDVIMCAVRQNEAYKVRNVVRDVDRNAFIIVGDATEILGEGFRSISENEFGESEE